MGRRLCACMGQFNSSIKIQLVIINGNVNAARYRDDVLRPIVLPLMRKAVDKTHAYSIQLTC